MSLINFSYEHTPKYALLYSVLFLLLLIDVQILPIFFDLNVSMILILASVYYWSVYHPSLIPSWLLFIVGVLRDLLAGFIFIGLSSIIFITINMIIKEQRTYMSGQSFFMIWAGYILVVVFSCLVFWLFLCLHLGEFAQYYSFLIEGGMMVLSFPLILSFTGVIHKLLPFASQDKASL